MSMIGGGGRSRIFRAKSDHKAIYSLLTGTVSPTSAADSAFMFGRDAASDSEGILMKTEFSYDDSGVPTTKFSQAKAGPDLDAFIDVFLPRKAGSSSSKVEELYDEVGFKIGGESAATDQQLGLLMSYLGIDKKSGKRGVKCSIGTFKKSSGGFSMEKDKYAAPPFEFTAASALETATSPSTGLVIPKALFDTSLVDVPETPASYEIPVGHYEKTFWFDPAD